MTGFDLERWYNETWSARILNESEMVLETEFLAVWCFFFGFISTTSSLKELFRLVPRVAKDVLFVLPIVQLTRNAVKAGGISALCGFGPELLQCTFQVHPWVVPKPACYLAVLDCHRLGVAGNMEEVKTNWSEFDRFSVVVIVHH
ncbi:hypothetical protein GQ600_8091 [Phytophthora cactorum]|nr:hypothetical protein GQ600_8091 [Phytophthora cactorum]